MRTAPELNLPRRPRRLRQTDAIRALTQETWLRPEDFVQPLFIVDGNGAPQPINSMPGINRLPIKHLIKACEQASELGIRGVKLFPYIEPSLKDAHGTEATNPNTLIIRAIKELKKHVPELIVMSDVALDLYTTHCHDGIFSADGLDIANDETVEILAKMCINHAEAGVDFVGPSDMMDGRIGAIRKALDRASFTRTGIIAYTAKYNSAFYGPYREAAGTAVSAKQGVLSKLTYQMHPGNRRAALIEAALDTEEGADILMIKPAGPYLDIIREIRNSTDLPIAGFQISGEYAQLQAAAQAGFIDIEKAREETLLAIKRAGADIILSYFAMDEAKAIQKRRA